MDQERTASVREISIRRPRPCEHCLDHRRRGQQGGCAKPLKGLGSGVLEIAVRHRTDAYRVVYVTEIAGTLWVLHAFQKKSRVGIKTPKAEIDLIRARLGRLRKELLL